jgi:hypothetical protein
MAGRAADYAGNAFEGYKRAEEARQAGVPKESQFDVASIKKMAFNN